jgi:hypothetical protein
MMIRSLTSKSTKAAGFSKEKLRSLLVVIRVLGEQLPSCSQEKAQM